MLQRRERQIHPAPNDLHLDNPSHTAAAGVVRVLARSVFMSLFVFPRWANKTRQLAGLFLSTAPIYVIGLVWYGASPQTTDVGFQPKQPVPYSHQLHAGQMGIDGRIVKPRG